MADESMNNPLIDEIAELVAYYCSQSRSCMKLAQQYYDENKILVEKKIKRICDGEEKLRLALSITGEYQMNCVLMMATIKAANTHDGIEYYVELVNTYLKNQKKEQLKPIKEKSLRAIYQDIISGRYTTEQAATIVLESDNFTAASRAFFYPLFLRDFIEERIIVSDEDFLKVFSAALSISDIIKAPVYNMYADENSWQANCIVSVMEKRYFKKTGTGFNKLKKVCRKYPNDFSRRQIASDELLTMTEAYLGFCNDGTGNDDICLTKELRGEIASIAYGALLGIYEEDDDIEYVLSAFASDNTLENQTDFVKELLDTFLSLIVEETHIYCLKYQYRKEILQNIYNYFFNPRGEKQEAALKETRKKLDQQIRENDSLKKYCKQYEQEAAQARTELTETKNNLASSKAKIDKLTVELNQANDRCRELEAELEKLKADSEQATAPAPETEPPSASPEEKPDYFQLLTDIFQNKTVVFIGGNQNIMGKFFKRYPKAIVIHQNRVPFAEQQIVQADALLFKPDSMGHKEYTPVKALAQKNNIPVGYVNNVANVGLMEQDVYQQLKKLRFVKEEERNDSERF